MTPKITPSARAAVCKSVRSLQIRFLFRFALRKERLAQEPSPGDVAVGNMITFFGPLLLAIQRDLVEREVRLWMPSLRSVSRGHNDSC